MDALQTALIDYGVRLLACQLGHPLPTNGPLAARLSADTRALPVLDRARTHLGDDDPLDRPNPPDQLTAIFALIAYDDELRQRPTPFLLPRRPLDLDLDQTESLEPVVLWNAFADDMARLPDGAGVFDTFVALMARYGSRVPGTLNLDGISVYEQFKAVALLCHTLAPEHHYHSVLLLEGDLSGIQETLYTITAKGAAKSLRGRSFYLQLLTDAVMRAILRALGLPMVCLVYNAGGTFQVIARAGDADRLPDIRRAINQRLLLLHGGELALALAWHPLHADDLTARAFTDTARQVGDLLEEQKARTFRDLVGADGVALFQATGSGSDRFCAICHVDLPDSRGAERPDDADDVRCDQCASFGSSGLARLIADANHVPYLSIEDLRPDATWPALPNPASWRGKPAWHRALAAFGFDYRFADQARTGANITHYRLNRSDFLPATIDGACRYSFRFLANTTPRIEHDQTQLQRLRAVMEQRRERNQEDPPVEEREIEPGAIRSTMLMARWDSHGIDRYGVLRMDIDDLGTLFRRRLLTPTLLHVSTLSATLSLFFEGWLNRACAHAADRWQTHIVGITNEHVWRRHIAERTGVPDEPDRVLRCKLPYVIYAGGDDLLIIGPWDVLPPLAWQIRRDLSSFAGRGVVDPAAPITPAPVTMSAGIFAENESFPLYQAADLAGSALKAAKRRKERRTVRGEAQLVTVKDAITLLDRTIPWDAFVIAEALACRLTRLIAMGVVNPNDPTRQDTAPHALLHLLAEVAHMYELAGGEASEGRMAYGRWMPLLAYGLRRMADRVPRHNEVLRTQILDLTGEALDLTRVEGAARWQTMRFLGVPVRWAEFLLRNGG